MPIPVISKFQSVLGYLQWQSFAFQPVASNSPTSWTCTPIAPGLLFNPATGLIQGAATMPGVYQFEMTATNATGTSLPEQFVMGIEASGFVRPANIIDIVIDVVTRRVYLAGVGVDAGSAGSASNLGLITDDPAKLVSLFMVKYDDDLIMNIRFTKGGVTYGPDITAFKFVLKEFEPESVLVSSSTYRRMGSGGESTSFLMHCKVTGPKLKAALTNYEDEKATQFPALAEFEWTEANTFSDPIVGPPTIKTSTRTFLVTLPRDLVPN